MIIKYMKRCKVCTYQLPWLHSSSWKQIENTWHPVRQRQERIPQLLWNKCIVHIPPKCLLLYRGYLKENFSASYDSWSTMMIINCVIWTSICVLHGYLYGEFVEMYFLFSSFRDNNSWPKNIYYTSLTIFFWCRRLI